MKRYLLAVARFWSASIAAEAEYRANFVLASLTGLMTLGGGVLSLHLFYGAGHELGGWPWYLALAVMGVYTFLSGVQQTLLQPNRSRVTEYVREGKLDFILLKPVDSQFWLSTHRISIWGLPDVVIGLLVVAYATGQMPEKPSGLAMLGAGAAVALALCILYGMGFVLSAITVWVVKLDNATVALNALLEAGRFPITAYAPAYRVFFTFVLPVAFMTTVPVRVVAGDGAAWSWLAGSAVASLGVLGFSRWLWLRALRAYSSASS
ncbi:MAG: ABC-2 family transporter protein [Planctomycetota bacterium]